jgi:hypothetical protein
MRCKNGKVKSGPRKNRCRKTKVAKCRQWALVHKPSLGRAVRTCVSRGKGRNVSRHEGSMLFGPTRASGLLGLDGFLGIF